MKELQNGYLILVPTTPYYLVLISFIYLFGLSLACESDSSNQQQYFFLFQTKPLQFVLLFSLRVSCLPY